MPPQLRDELARGGFEVGVHDLRHDGKLYRSRRMFAQKALRINQHLKDWSATGFRSGFMFHKLDWLHDLNIDYERYGESLWNPLPRELAAFMKRLQTMRL